jgi:hypothetical protein
MSLSLKKTVSRSKSVKASASTSTKNTLYETPALGIFISRGGEIRREVLAHERVRPLDSLADDLGRLAMANQELHVGNTPMRVLSATEGGDLASALGISKELADSLKLAAEAISVISVVGTVVSVAISAMQLFGIFGEEQNPYDELYGRIELRLRGILKSTLAGQTLQTMQQINMLLGHSETAGSIVGDYLLNPTPAREALLSQADYWSQYALNTLRGEALWLRTYDDEAATLKLVEVRGWEFGPTVRPDLLMWDWRLPLLAYLKALAARIAVIHTIDPAVDSAHRAEILGHAKFLQTVEQRIRIGFSRSVPIPNPGYNYWMITARDACGVVEVQSGASDFSGSWTPTYWFRDQIDTDYAKSHPLPTTYDEYIKWHRHGVETRYWRLYDSLGLFSLWSIIPDVQTAAKGLPSFGKTTKAVLEGYKLSALTESTGVAKMRLDAYTRWSEQSRAGMKEQKG